MKEVESKNLPTISFQFATSSLTESWSGSLTDMSVRTISVSRTMLLLVINALISSDEVVSSPNEHMVTNRSHIPAIQSKAGPSRSVNILNRCDDLTSQFLRGKYSFYSIPYLMHQPR